MKTEYKCRKCNCQIQDGKGHVQISQSDYYDYRARQELVPWYAVHINCEPSGEYYAIHVEDVRTSFQKKECLQHMREKNWFGQTDRMQTIFQMDQ